MMYNDDVYLFIFFMVNHLNQIYLHMIHLLVLILMDLVIKLIILIYLFNQDFEVIYFPNFVLLFIKHQHFFKFHSFRSILNLKILQKMNFQE